MLKDLRCWWIQRMLSLELRWSSDLPPQPTTPKLNDETLSNRRLRPTTVNSTTFFPGDNRTEISLLMLPEPTTAGRLCFRVWHQHHLGHYFHSVEPRPRLGTGKIGVNHKPSQAISHGTSRLPPRRTDKNDICQTQFLALIGGLRRTRSRARLCFAWQPT